MLVMMRDLFQASGTDAPAAQHVLEKRTDVGWTLRAAELHEKDGIEWLGHEMVGL